MDFMDKIVADLQQKEQPVVAQPQVFASAEQPQAQPQQPVQPVAEPVVVPQAVPQTDSMDDVDKLLAGIVEQLEQPSQPQNPVVEPQQNVNNIDTILDNEKLSLEERQEIVKYIDDLSEENIKYEQEKRVLKIERDQLEQLLEKERVKAQEFFDKARELEREQKKIKSSAYPDDLGSLVDYFKLTKENPSIYNKQNLVAQAARVIEQVTETPMDDYIISWL
jgi:DNA-dependent RNA polymerase auxiliary subunit epsilon